MGVIPIMIRRKSGVIPTTVPASVPVNYTKNVQRIEDVNYYESFGHVLLRDSSTLVYKYRRGTAHLISGVAIERTLNLNDSLWSTATTFHTDDLDLRDQWGGKMDNGEEVVFSCTSEYSGTGTSLKSHAYVQIRSVGGVYNTPTSIFNGTIPEMQRGLGFGGMQKGTAAGTYYMAVWQYNSDAGTTDKPTFPLYRLDILKTTDYWQTWTNYLVYEGTSNGSEAALAVFPDGQRMTVLRRIDPGGFPYVYESSDGGVTWTARGSTRDIGYAGAKSKNFFLYINQAGTLDIFFQCRDSGWIGVSWNNNPDTFFGGATFNPPELIYYNRFGTILAGDNFSLGYVSATEIEANKYIIVWAQQESTSKANLWYTFYDKSVGLTSPPDAPPLKVNTSATTSSTALVYCMQYDEGGYTRDQTAQIQWFEVSVSKDPNFGSFETIQWETSSGPTALAQDYRFGDSSQWNMRTLTTATTYYVRARACNNAGKSAYSTISFTTT